MGLITGLLTLPLAPVRGVAWLGERILEQAEQEMYDPAAIRRQLSEVERARAAGELSADEAADLENELLGRMMTERSGPGE
ncbi:gas vesicle protein GvpG [Actinomadura scrupuli]|uniref:gas vesicle protein GvpG n=1 Tax=Actinomadura scrupuli TaxID=559629 RepID=UPI003D967EC2